MEEVFKKICIVCKEEKEVIKFDYSAVGRRRNVCEKCRNLRKRAALWIHFLRAFEFKCTCCGENDIRFLTVDHINNDGYLDRLQNKDNKLILMQAKEDKFDRSRYTCLCYNCNCGKQRNNGICPHKEISKEEYKEIYLRTGEERLKPGREMIYEGDKNERNKQAQVNFKVNQSLNKLSKEEIERLIEKLQKV